MDLDLEVYDIDGNEYDALSDLVGELAKKHGIDFGGRLDDFMVLFYEKFRKIRMKGVYQRANEILQICNLQGDAKIIAANGSVEINRNILEHIQHLLYNDRDKILNSAIFIGLTDEEKYSHIEKLAMDEKKREKHFFNVQFKETVQTLKYWGIFLDKNNSGVEVKTVRENEGAFLFDLFFIMQRRFGFCFPFRWGDPTDESEDILDNKQKRLNVIKRLKNKH